MITSGDHDDNDDDSNANGGGSSGSKESESLGQRMFKRLRINWRNLS
jgi:hypothetical protein